MQQFSAGWSASPVGKPAIIGQSNQGYAFSEGGVSGQIPALI
jgi:hypothetical protein